MVDASGSAAVPPTIAAGSSKTMRWVFTVNNPGDWVPAFDARTMEYLCWGAEVAPTTGTHHLQGYVAFKNRKNNAGAAALAMGRREMWCASAKGTEQQCKDYCAKDGNFVEFGTFDAARGTQGRRTDLTSLAKSIKENGLKAAAREHPETFIKYPGGAERYAQLCRDVPVRRDVHTTILWGPTGVGKSHRVLTAYPEAYLTIMSQKNPWDLYQGQKVLIIDEFNPLHCSVQDMNKVTDVWKCTLQARYANKEAEWDKIYILSNIDPILWYASLEDPGSVAALRRRILQEPMGAAYEVRDQEQVVDLTWWIPKDLAAAAAPAAPAPTPDLPDDNPAPLKRSNAMAHLWAMRGGTSTAPLELDD